MSPSRHNSASEYNYTSDSEKDVKIENSLVSSLKNKNNMGSPTLYRSIKIFIQSNIADNILCHRVEVCK